MPAALACSHRACPWSSRKVLPSVLASGSGADHEQREVRVREPRNDGLSPTTPQSSSQNGQIGWAMWRKGGSPPPLLLETPEHERRVRATKAEGIRQRNIDVM